MCPYVAFTYVEYSSRELDCVRVRVIVVVDNDDVEMESMIVKYRANQQNR